MLRFYLLLLQNLFKHLPSQRTLDQRDIDTAQKLLLLKSNKQLVQEELSRTTGKVMALRDLSNLGASSTENDSHKSDELC